MKKIRQLALMVLAGCAGLPQVDAGVVDSDIDAGALDAGVDGGPLPLSWRLVLEVPPTRSNHVSFYWPPAQRTLVFSGNHVTGPIHDAWDWNGETWARRALPDTTYPERKNAGLAVDARGQQVFVFGGTWSGYPVAGGPHVVRVLGDLQRWTGTWSEVSVDGGPSARGGAAMAWDEARGEALLFGGSDNQDTFGDTWTFDGTTWRARATGMNDVRPPARLNARLAWDARRERLVLFGGQAIAPDGDALNLDDTWEWDGASWRDVSGPGPRPPGRGHHALEYDPLTQRVLLFGGARHFAPLPSGSALGDLWQWDGQQWQRLEPPGARPSPRVATSLSFDPMRRVLVLFGGFEEFDLNDVWEWNGTQWTERSLLPVPRSDFSFAQPGPGEPAVLFGGYLTGGGKYLNDTWRNEAGRWVRVEGTAPTPRSGACLGAYGRDMVLLGGVSGSGSMPVVQTDAWTLSAGESSWKRFTGRTPTARRDGVMGYDRERKVSVLFGGRTAQTVLGDTWLWNGQAWTILNPTTSPPPRVGGALEFDPVRKQLVLIGGQGADRRPLGDAWAFDGQEWTQLELAQAPLRIDGVAGFDGFGRLVQWGGRSGTTLLDDVGVRTVAAWLELPTGPSARFDAAWVNHGDGWTTVFGSRSDFSTSWDDLSDVWELRPEPSSR